MTSVRRRAKSNGTVSYTVLWRPGGTRGGKQESENFDDLAAAERFKRMRKEN
ncbi:hypothetical protein [Streptomyces sp. AJS327]|uniref:hypothetical protein n=1 Tax=Streptomyces sp. AJS327 TaxID=2545265 RepID=UPI0015DEC8FC|nr:hypothetical protein [Streptomyces sp. AJS327]